jgi:hypothetical protein
MQQAAAAREQRAAEVAAATATFLALATPDDERMRAAIALSDAALRRRVPVGASNAGGSSDWLQRLREADAALQSAMVRRDAERYGGSQPPTLP